MAQELEELKRSIREIGGINLKGDFEEEYGPLSSRIKQLVGTFINAGRIEELLAESGGEESVFRMMCKEQMVPGQAIKDIISACKREDFEKIYNNEENIFHIVAQRGGSTLWRHTEQVAKKAQGRDGGLALAKSSVSALKKQAMDVFVTAESRVNADEKEAREILDFFRNSTSAGNLDVDSVLKSSRTSMYAAVLRSESPSNFIPEASFERSLLRQLEKEEESRLFTHNHQQEVVVEVTGSQPMLIKTDDSKDKVITILQGGAEEMAKFLSKILQQKHEEYTNLNFLADLSNAMTVFILEKQKDVAKGEVHKICGELLNSKFDDVMRTYDEIVPALGDNKAVDNRGMFRKFVDMFVSLFGCGSKEEAKDKSDTQGQLFETSLALIKSLPPITEASRVEQPSSFAAREESSNGKTRS